MCLYNIHIWCVCVCMYISDEKNEHKKKSYLSKNFSRVGTYDSHSTKLISNTERKKNSKESSAHA